MSSSNFRNCPLRFIDNNGGNQGPIQNLKVRSIIAVELNAFLFWNAKIIAEFHGYAKNSMKQQEFERKAEEILVVMLKLAKHQK
jgi:alpha,alpha-trehalase